MPTAAQLLGDYAANLKFDDIPAAVIKHAKHCMMDTVGAAVFGSQFPWSRMVAAYATAYGGAGKCSLIAMPGVHVQTPSAALANGVFAHAFELDCVGKANCGAHPGATLVPAILAGCEEVGADGKTAITAFVAGCEIITRIGAAACHSSEALGFHAPGLNGPYGAAVAAGRVFGLTGEQIGHAMGIAGSLSSGLLAFTKSQQGAMVKRLHLGRASEAGILAARLAAQGYTGPETVLEGKFGFLDVYCRNANPALLTAGLHKQWETLQTGMKRYSCHLYAHTPVVSLRELMAENGFQPSDVAKIVVEGTETLLSHHDIRAPREIAKAQYSVPFSVAIALHRDPEDPKSFDASAVDDAAIIETCRNVELKLKAGASPSARSTRITVRLKDGREFVRARDSFKGMPEEPLNIADVRFKFMRLAAGLGEAAAERLFERLENMDTEGRFSVA